MSDKYISEIEKHIRNNTSWINLPVHVKQILNLPDEYNQHILNYSLKNQLRYRGNLVRTIYKNEKLYYELLIEKSKNNLCLFPYHIADIVTRGLRVTPFNFYVEILCNFLKNEKSYDTLPNFTAADCLRVLGIGRNEYLSLASHLKMNSSKLFRKINPKHILQKCPVKINIEPWWIIKIGCILENDIKYVDESEKKLIDELIDSGPQFAGKCDYNVIHSLYRKGLIYLDVPINDSDRICIPPLRNFVMNRLSGDYFENLLYKIFVSVDEHMTIYELSKVLQIDLESVKYAVSLICRLGFAKKLSNDMENLNLDDSWKNHSSDDFSFAALQISYELNKNNNNSNKGNFENDSENDSITGDMEQFVNIDSMSCNNISSNNNENKMTTTTITTASAPKIIKAISPTKSGKRIGFLFDSTLTAFLMMGNLSPGLKNHAVTMFEVGKLCEESMDTFLAELEKVSLLDAEGEGEVSQYFAHAVILRSTIIVLRAAFENGLDLLRLECLESLDYKTRNRLLGKKYKFIISASPLTGYLSHPITVPIFGQFYHSSNTSHIWTKLFYYHISGYGPPSLFLRKGTVLNQLPRLFLGYGKLLVTIVHTDSYVLSSENFLNINEQLRNDCVLIQGYGIKNIGILKYISFPFDMTDALKFQWTKHKCIEKLKKHLDLETNCGYITFVNTGVPDIGCEDNDYDINVKLTRSKTRRKKSLPVNSIHSNNMNHFDHDLLDVQIELTEHSTQEPEIFDICSPNNDNSELTSFNRSNEIKLSTTLSPDSNLKTPDENYFAITPQNSSSSDVFTSEDCSEIVAKISDNKKISQNMKISNNEDNSKNIRTEKQQSKQKIDDKNSEMINELLEKKDSHEFIEANNMDGEMWTLLDVHFGVPLFDADCNIRICEQIVKNLSSDENLERLLSSQASMNKQFLEFVKQCLYFDDESNEIVKIGKLLPPPRINLAFENGKVCCWNGK